MRCLDRQQSLEFGIVEKKPNDGTQVAVFFFALLLLCDRNRLFQRVRFAVEFCTLGFDLGFAFFEDGESVTTFRHIAASRQAVVNL